MNSKFRCGCNGSHSRRIGNDDRDNERSYRGTRAPLNDGANFPKKNDATADDAGS